ncbi:alpha-glucan family phosphorylase [Candidatus Woesearchaeota archaeon]|nr:alpha-glucan family phosphorylase [Candidatus Woesearchaeota archaeon]
MERFFKKEAEKKIAYFSMEIGIDSKIPTFSGGLGVLAGDTIRSAADLNVPMIAISLIHEHGYFSQTINNDGVQEEIPQKWNFNEFLTPLENTVIIHIEGREVKIKAWQIDVVGVKGYKVPVYLLDTNLPENSEYDRELTSYLYGGDLKYRLCQEIVLGIGGLRMIESLGYSDIEKYHMNEGHASFLSLELMRQGRDLETVRDSCVFTTHTPVPAGHDRFDKDLVKSVFANFPFDTPDIIDFEGKVNMTLIGLHFSGYVNGVAKKHSQVSQEMFPNYPIHSITNGVHSGFWTCDEFSNLFDKHIPEWRKESFALRYAAGIPLNEIEEAHRKAKQKLMDYINEKHNANFTSDILTIGFARRSTSYKRPDLVLRDLDRLKDIAQKRGPIQFVFAGKAHKRDFNGKDIIKKIFSMRLGLGENIKLVYLENYNIDLAKIIIPGVDLWLNTPQRPKEASGTSGMKAAHNGVPSLSILDGWWIEGCIEGVTGWAIGNNDPSTDDVSDSNSLYNVLEEKIIPLYYHHKEEWVEIMRNSIAINASFFNTCRMLNQYVVKAYFN